MLPTTAQQDAMNILHFMFENQLGSGIHKGSQLKAAISAEEARAVKAIMLLIGRNFIRIVYEPQGNINIYILNHYTFTPLGVIALDTLQSGDNPFKFPPSVNHTGDVINTRVGNVTNSAFAIGSHAQATYAPGIDAEAFNSKMAELQTLLQQLPDAEREDGEHQLDALARAAQEGPEAVEKRAGLFYRYLQGIWGVTENAATGMFMYHAAAALFAHAGVTFPALLPPGL